MAEAGDVTAQFILEVMYGNGHCVPQNYAEAAKWFHRAFEAGDAAAQNNLGFMYSEGQSVPQDYVTAHMWANLVASNGHHLAAKNRDSVASRMSPAAIEQAQARAAQCLASDYQDCGG